MPRPAFLAEPLERRRLLAAHMLADVHRITAHSFPQQFTDVDGTVFFAADHRDAGLELWKTDGTEAGTVLVKDVNPDLDSNGYPTGSQLQGFANLDGVLLFVAWDSQHAGGHGGELWRSDGTATGTYLVKDIWPGSSSGVVGFSIGGNVFNGEMLVHDGVAYFAGQTPAGGVELWRTDGTEAGTFALTDVPGSASPRGLVAMGSHVYFHAFGTGANGSFTRELYQTDGTVPGTARLKEIHPTASAFQASDKIVAAGDRLYFTADDGTGRRLWTSDGTADGTVVVFPQGPPNPPGPTPTLFFSAAGRAFFSAGTSLWTTDGTIPGTVRLAADVGGTPGNFTALGDTAFFLVTSASKPAELWRSDGTPAGTLKVATVAIHPLGPPKALVELNGALYFGTQTAAIPRPQLWRSDGTAAGTMPVDDLPGASGPATPAISNLAAAGGALYFLAYDPVVGNEPWVSDGTRQGTRLLADTNRDVPETARGPIGLVDLGPRVVFAQDDGVHGLELWSADAATGAVSMVTDLRPGPNAGVRPFPGGSFDHFRLGAALGGFLYFHGYDGTSAGLWRTDGTAAGTSLVEALDYIVTSPGMTGVPTLFDGAVYFTADDGRGGELWRSDGTPAGTDILRELTPGPAGTNPAHLTVSGGFLYFSAAPHGTTAALWKTDGTADGTVPLKTGMVPPSTVPAWNAIHSILARPGGGVYFGAYTADAGNELWKSDGTEAGTVMVKDIIAGPTDSLVRAAVVVHDAVYFTARTGETFHTHLWRSDGTEAGTVRLTDGQNVIAAVAAGDAVLYHTATTNLGELWKTDGTPDGESLLIRSAAPTPSNPVRLLSSDGRVAYFTGRMDGYGAELWRTDGTTEGTWMVQDVAPGAASSSPTRVQPVGDRLYFTADDRDHGPELWRFDPATVVGRHVARRDASAAGGVVIAADKAPLLPGQAASYSNVVADSRGITAVVIDLTGMPPGATLGARDFEIVAGTDPAGWSPAPAPSQVIVAPGAGASSRVMLTWPGGALRNTWLRVTVKATGATGLSTADAFYVGSLPGATGEGGGRPLVVSAVDLAAVRRHVGTASPSALRRFDFTRDGVVNGLDVLVARNNNRAGLHPLTPPAPAEALRLPLPAPPPPPSPSSRRGVWSELAVETAAHP